MTERVLVRSLLADSEVRQALLQPLAQSEAVRRFSLWPAIQAVLDLSDTGEASDIFCS